jgi:hypothetical protein
MDGNKNNDAEHLVNLTENAIVTMHLVRDRLTTMQQKDKKKPSQDEELHEKIRSKTMKMIKGDTR